MGKQRKRIVGEEGSGNVFGDDQGGEDNKQ